MLRLPAKIGCLGAGAFTGFFVYIHMQTVFEGYVPFGAAAAVAVFVFIILYFPLFRPIADAASDRVAVAIHRGRHIRSGSGVDELQEQSSIRCAICGNKRGPVCPSCQAEMNRGTRV